MAVITIKWPYNKKKVIRMSICDNKMAVLRQLGQESDPISLPELLEKLGKDFKERSVRRWLSLLIEEGLVQKIGQRKGTKYISIGSNLENISDVGAFFSPESLDAIELISRPLFERTPVAYSDEWLENYEPNSDYYLKESLRELLFNSGQRSKDTDPAGTYANKIFNRLLIDLSYNSSRLEGNTYSLLDTERLLLHGDTVEGKLDEEKIMILNHKEAIRYLVENAFNMDFSRNTICTIHYLLSDGLVDPSESGKIRNYGVRISGSTYIPFEDSKRLDLQLEKISKKAADIKDPYEKSIFLLIHISYLQAFIDVNKRTARLSANISLIKENLVPIAFSDIEVSDYRSAMIAIYEMQNIQPIVDLYVHSYMRTCAAYDSTVKSLGFDEVRVRYRTQRRSLIRSIITQKLSGNTMKQFILSESGKIIPSSDSDAFVEDVFSRFK